MATFTTGLNKQANFDNFDIDDLHGSYLYIANATTWRVGPFFVDTGTFVQFTGNGFTYTGGALTGGTITSIASYTVGGLDFQITGLALSAATYHAYAVAHDTEGFLATVFAGADDLTGAALDDHLYGYAGNDKLTGLDGDDILDGGAGSDTLIGGKGSDVYVIDSAGDIIQESGGSLHDRVQSAISVDLTKLAFLGIEDIVLTGKANLSATGSNQANIIFGNEGANTLTGNLGDDQLMGWAGNDTLDGGKGGDVMYGGAGDDVYYVDSFFDDVFEVDQLLAFDTGGKDSVFSSVDFYLPSYVENLTLTGTAVHGVGNNLANNIVGNAADNGLEGGSGADTMTGGLGNDTYSVDDIMDKIVENNVTDTGDRVLSTATYTLPQYVENLSLMGLAKIDGTGNDLRNEIHGNANANTIDGKAGDDQLYGVSGDDILIGGTGNDWLIGGYGADKLDGGAGNDLLIGGQGDDIIDVSQGNDLVLYDEPTDGHDLLQGFDGTAAGGQDYLDISGFLYYLGIDNADRASRVGVVDNGASVEIWLDYDGDKSLDSSIVTINTTDTITVGEDVVLVPLF